MFCFSAKIARTSLLCNAFLIFSYPSHLKHLVLRAFLEDCLPERLSKVGVLAERGMKKSNTSRTQRTQGRNIPVQGNPSLRCSQHLHIGFLFEGALGGRYVSCSSREHPCSSRISLPPDLSQGLPELRQSLPELTQTSTASEGRRSSC